MLIRRITLFRFGINVKYSLIITTKSPHMSCGVDEPREVKSEDVTEDGL